MSDLIERDKTIDAIKCHIKTIDGDNDALDYIATNMLKDVPSARPKGEWIARIPSDSGLCTVYECPYCKYEVDCVPTNYCPNCGADMREREGE